MKKVYFISGLGADKRVFTFLDLSFCDPAFIDWLKPQNNDSLESYAIRLRNEIPERDPVIVGISLGGMLVTEMAKADKNIKAIIISSNKTISEFPAYLRIGKYLPLYKWSHPTITKKIILNLRWILGGRKKEQNQLLKDIINDSDISFTKWAVHAIMHWKNNIVPSNLIHIHGTADKLLPYRSVKADHSIKGGTHVMTMDQHEEVSALLKKLIGRS